MPKPCLPDKTHHWLIETGRGPTSQGQCKYCHQTRRFVNSTTDASLTEYYAMRRASDDRQDGGDRVQL